MAPLAGWMARAGFSVCGYDDNLQESVRHFLADAGVLLKDFIPTEQFGQFDVVVYSNAIRSDHPLLVTARKQGLKTLLRGEMLAEIAASKRLIAVVGSHGKTTTIGMIAHATHRCGLGINYIVGGLFKDASLPPSQYADSEWLVAEVDESDGTIDHFSPEITVLLNADWDHADRYTKRAMLTETFQGILQRTKSHVLVPTAEAIGTDYFTQANISKRLTFGENGDFGVSSNVDGQLQLSGRFGRSTVNSPPGGGYINCINGAAALAVLHLLSVKWPVDVLSGFCGMARRQTVLHSEEQLIVVEDYAHHPTEIAALFADLRAMAPEHELVVIFQPHRYSRTKQFRHEFVDVLQEADKLFLLPVYAAHESVIEGGTTEAFVRSFHKTAPEVLTMDPEGVKRLHDSIGEEQSLVAFVGAGDIHLFAGFFTSMHRNKHKVELAWRDFLKSRVSPECVLRESEPLANKTTMRVGGAARFYAEPANLCDLRALLRAAKLFDLEVFCLGRGSNLLVSDAGFEGLVIRFAGAAWRQIEMLDEGRIWVAAGLRLKELCGYAARAGLKGFEFLEGIPGTVGGALRMNAGAMGKWIFDVVECVQFLDEDGRLQDLSRDAFHVEYRKVEEISRGIALGAILKSSEIEEENYIRKRMDGYSDLRKSSQPRNPSAGCIFKNPEGNFAGKLIETCGLKGMCVGGAEVSEVHANFIVNRSSASATDVINLVRQVRSVIQSKSGYTLEPEVLLLGQSWDDVLEDKETFRANINGE